MTTKLFVASCNKCMSNLITDILLHFKYHLCDGKDFQFETKNKILECVFDVRIL